jgi:hypothetical protein
MLRTKATLDLALTRAINYDRYIVKATGAVDVNNSRNMFIKTGHWLLVSILIPYQGYLHTCDH